MKMNYSALLSFFPHAIWGSRADNPSVGAPWALRGRSGTSLGELFFCCKIQGLLHLGCSRGGAA